MYTMRFCNSLYLVPQSLKIGKSNNVSLWEAWLLVWCINLVHNDTHLKSAGHIDTKAVRI
jgi:hypothetical protein